YRGVVGHAGVAEHGERAKSAALRADRSLAESADYGPIRLCLLGRNLAEALVGRRGEERGRTGCDGRRSGRLPPSPGRLRGRQGGRGELAELSTSPQGAG